MFEKFGEKLTTLRKKHGLSIRQLGFMLDVSHSFISQLERGIRNPNVIMLLKIADIFGVTTDQLIRDELEV